MATGNLPKRYVTPLLVWALLFGIVGLGNVWIGYTKQNYYASAISEARTNPKVDVSAYKHSIYTKRLDSRIGYYSLVYNGGLCLLAISAILLSIAIIRPFKYRGNRGGQE